MTEKIALGRKGESYVCEYLKSKGYIINEVNYHSRYGEIDIISQNEKYLVFVEVKTRKSFNFSRAIEAVNRSKRIKIIKTAYFYISSKSLNKQPRFDVAEVLIDSKEIKKLLYHENSFSVEECDAFF